MRLTKALAIAAALLFGVSSASAEMDLAPPSKSHRYVIERASGDGCGFGAYRAPNGSCDIVRDPNAICQPGLHAVAGPFESGFRCVQDGY
jgi:hypothetical protein